MIFCSKMSFFLFLKVIPMLFLKRCYTFMLLNLLNLAHPGCKNLKNSRVNASSKTQGQSVGLGEKAGRKFSSTGKRAPGYRLSPNYFQKFKQMPAPDWAQKMLCIIVPNRRTVSREFFSWVREFVPRHMKSDEGLFWKSSSQPRYHLPCLQAPSGTKRPLRFMQRGECFHP